MTIFTTESRLDPEVMFRQIEAALDQAIFTPETRLDQELMFQQLGAVLGDIFSPMSRLDPETMLREIDEAVAIVTAIVTDITITAQTIAENSAQGTPVGTLAAVGATATFSLIDNASNRFQLVGSQIQAGSAGTDFETGTSHDVTVRATSAGGTFDKEFTITVTDVSESEQVEAPSVLSHRYWSINITARANSATEAGVLELEFGKLGLPKAAGGTASATTTFGGFVPANAIDGNNGTQWIASSGAHPQRLAVDFGSAVDVNVVRLLGRDYTGPTATYTFTVDHSDNGTDWTTAWTCTAAPVYTGYDLKMFPNPNCTVGDKVLWRLVFVAGLNVKVAEMELRDAVGGADKTISTNRIQANEVGSSLFPTRLIDNNSATYFESGVPGATVVYEFEGSFAAKELALQATTEQGHMPPAFILSHSADGISWTEALNISGLTWSASEQKTWAIP